MTPNIAKACELMENPEDYMWFDVSGQVKVSSVDTHTIFQQQPPFDRVAIVMKGENDTCVAVWTYRPETNLSLVWLLIRGHGLVFGGAYSAETRSWRELENAPQPDNESPGKVAVTLVALLQSALETGASYSSAKANQANKRRRLQGKKPLYDWHTVVLEPKAPKQEPKGGTHASPRPHDRRGHYRTYKSGKQVWVRNMRVGKGEGFVFKDYIVKPNTNVLDKL